MARLPLEVVGLIIDDVGANLHNDFSSIKACALVCHSFLPLCRKYIFACVTLNWNLPHHSSLPTSDQLNNLLSNSPHLAEYIRELDYPFTEKEFGPKRSPWLSSMFKKLVKLQKLSLSYSTFTQGRLLNWMSSYKRMVLLPLLQLPTLTWISLFKIRNFPMADLAGCANLKNLEIWGLECSKGVGEFLEALPPTPVMLELLDFNCRNIKTVLRACKARRPDGKPIIDFSSLKQITAIVERLDSMKELFGMCRNLQKIDINSKCLSTSCPLHPFDLTLIVDDGMSYDPSKSPSLKGLLTMLEHSLHTLVDINIEYGIHNEETYDGALASLCHELEKMIGKNVVETINLEILVTGDCSRLGELDDVLMGFPGGWPALRKVSILLIVVMPSNNELKALQGIPFAKLVESKRVEFDLELAYDAADLTEEDQ